MACSSCARKSANRAKQMSQRYLNNPKRIARLLKEAERKGDAAKVKELKSKLNQ